MKRIQAFWHRQEQLILSQRYVAISYALAFSCLPFTSWLSVVIVALITLRKGCLEGMMLLLPVVVLHCVYSIATLPFAAAVLNTLILFVPCYLAAGVLRFTASWQAVACFFFLCVSLSVILIQFFVPELVIAQYQYVLEILKVSHHGAVSQMLNETSNVSQQSLASYTFGVQLLSVVFSTMLSLVVARSMQSRLFNPGGFRQELMLFSATRFSLAIVLILCLAALKDNLVAMMLLPLVIFYFLLAGLSLSAKVLAQKNARLVFFVLIAPLLVLPFVMVPLYGAIGLLDGLFNFKTVKPKRRG